MSKQAIEVCGGDAPLEGEVAAGEYVWRPKGSTHVATAPEGALLLGMFLRPNRFL